MQMNLKTKLSAYPKLAPGMMDNYYTKEELDEKFRGYVEEAPVDDSVYGRGNKEWVRLHPSALDAIMLRWGYNNKAEITAEDILALQYSAVLSRNIKADTVEQKASFTMNADSYVWFCPTDKIASIEASLDAALNTTCDYIEQEDKVAVEDLGRSFYCYRINEKLIKDHLWQFTLKITTGDKGEED